MASLPQYAVREMVKFFASFVELAESDDPDDAFLGRKAMHLLSFLRRPKAPKKKLAEPSRKETKKAKQEAHAAWTGRVRAAVWHRSKGMCECGCGEYLGDSAGEMDHFNGGSRRRGLTTEANCWRLAQACHRNKTNNRPSRAHWEVTFKQHLERCGYTVPKELL